MQNKTLLKLNKLQRNILAVALDHMWDHLNDIKEDIDNYEDEILNIKRIQALEDMQMYFANKGDYIYKQPYGFN